MNTLKGGRRVSSYVVLDADGVPVPGESRKGDLLLQGKVEGHVLGCVHLVPQKDKQTGNWFCGCVGTSCHNCGRKIVAR